MKTKRSKVTVALVLVLGLTLFTVATVAASSTNVGYEAFKETMDDINHDDATSGQMKVTLTDNGITVFDIDAEAFGSKADKDFSGAASLSDGDMTKVLEFYGQEDSVYIIDALNDGYYQIIDSDDSANDYGRDKGDDHEMTAIEEELLDYFVGDLKDNFVVEEAEDGSKELSFNMEASEVPTGLNLLIKAGSAAEHRTEDQHEAHMEELDFMDGFDFDAKPDLVEDVQLELVSLQLTVDADNQITGISTKIAFSGLDEEGVDHNVVIEIEGTMGYGSVDVETIDTDAYDWEVVEHEERDMKRGHQRR